MYKPEDILTIAQLGAYLRSTEEQMLILTNGAKVIYDLKTMEITKTDYPQNLTTVFQRFYIPKRNKNLGFRIVYKTKDQKTNDILKVLKFNLDDVFKPVAYVHGFVRNRSTRTNALMHLDKKFLLKLDIENFFESIDINQVKSGFISLGFIDEIAHALSEITTLEGKLIQGFQSSPVIANIVFTQLDIKLNKLCEENNWVYSRYADDISISSDLEPPKRDVITELIESHEFRINNSKTQQFRRGQNQYVTGLSISDKKYPRIPKAVKRRIRQQLYYIRTYGIHSHISHINNWDEETDTSATNLLSHELGNKLKGWIDYIHSIEPVQAEKYYKEYNLIVKNEAKKREELRASNEQKGGIITLNLELKEPIPKRK